MPSFRPLDRPAIEAVFEALDRELTGSVRLVVGGGAAMTLAYDHPLATQDVDGFVASGDVDPEILEAAARKVGRELGHDPAWLNSYFLTFTHVLPADYQVRLKPVFSGRHLVVKALGPEDLLIMKCFAGRERDRSHARRLLALVADLAFVDDHLSALAERRIPGADRALDLFDDLRDEVGR